ncbi:MAG: hypothetical protein ACXACI_06125, partial [Candidatus Hodarchaeales archaeon]
FDKLWTWTSYHHNRALIWCYTTGVTNKDDYYPKQREMYCLWQHTTRGGFSVNYMFDGPGDSYTYGLDEVFWCEYAFEEATGHDMQQHKVMGSHNFYL